MTMITGFCRALMVTALALLGLLSVQAPSAHALDTTVLPTDANIRYTGRWDTTVPTAYVPAWSGAYLTTDFTGTTVKLVQRGPVNFYASVDGGEFVFYGSATGIVDLTPAPLAPGTHTLRVSYRSADVVFQGLVLDDGAATVASQAPTKLVEFVGDSITAGALTDRLALDSYGWRLGEQLGTAHTRIARSGYCLVAYTGCTGQSTQYFKQDSLSTIDWDFSRYTADAVVINLGTNDFGHGVPSATFQDAYTAFIADIRARFPGAAIFAMDTLKHRYTAETQAAVAAANAAGDEHVHFVDTTGWLVDGADYEDGNGHPNESGNQKIADRLAPIVAPAIGL
ncbi:GDSL-type esterase/lipase family protein [Streptomyces sp. NPDC050803]|uniref:SGNH/GDSL hydrolase family protein n=1 Tax=unclassified Streptomyces TaxID=2593676 RepID=UPI0034240D66